MNSPGCSPDPGSAPACARPPAPSEPGCRRTRFFPHAASLAGVLLFASCEPGWWTGGLNQASDHASINCIVGAWLDRMQEPNAPIGFLYG